MRDNMWFRMSNFLPIDERVNQTSCDLLLKKDLILKIRKVEGNFMISFIRW